MPVHKDIYVHILPRHNLPKRIRKEYPMYYSFSVLAAVKMLVLHLNWFTWHKVLSDPCSIWLYHSQCYNVDCNSSFRMWGIYKLVCTSWQHVIQFLLAMISDQLSNLSQFPIQLCIIPKWYNGKIMQKCEHENGGNLRSSTWKKIFPQNYFLWTWNIIFISVSHVF